MKKYISENLEPLLIRFVIAFLVIYFFESVSDIIIKIAILKNKN